FSELYGKNSRIVLPRQQEQYMAQLDVIKPRSGDRNTLTAKRIDRKTTGRGNYKERTNR
ncbi:hypothetical protein HHI36_011778, partial [Cryptolaemus montrouzieri]